MIEITASLEDKIRQYALNKYPSRFKKGIKEVKYNDGFAEIWGITNGPIFLSATLVREINQMSL